MIVLDASVFVEIVMRTRLGRAARDAIAASDGLHVPEVFDLEVVQSLRRLVRGRLVTLSRAGIGLELMEHMPLERHRHRAHIDDVWALRDRCSAYDAAYVALARTIEAELLTADAKLARAADGVVPVCLVA